MKQYKIGDIVRCKVSGIEPYGVFVVVDKSYSGLIHISEVSNEFVRDINDYVKINDKIFCKVIEVNKETKQLKLSIKDIDYVNTGMERDHIDTKKGFMKLKENLPIWMEDKLKEYEKE